MALPNAGAGPFRDIEQLELGNSRPAPYALKDDRDYPRDVSVVDVDGDEATVEVVAYAARTAFPEGTDPDPTTPSNEIVRFRALDGRSFERQFDTVLEPELDWEGGVLGAPSALRVGSELWLYYAAAGGIGRAVSSDGVSFQRSPAPVLGPDDESWELGVVPTSPAVLALPDGTFRMFYEVALGPEEAAIAEASSADGVAWIRLATNGPVLAPRAPAGELAAPYDELSVEAPWALIHPSSSGRTLLWLYYSALDAAGRRTIAVAARDGVDGPFVRAVAPVYGTSGALGPNEPVVLRYPGFALLFVTERAGKTAAQDFPAVAVGVAPATALLPPRVED